MNTNTDMNYQNRPTLPRQPLEKYQNNEKQPKQSFKNAKAALTK